MYKNCYYYDDDDDDDDDDGDDDDDDDDDDGADSLGSSWILIGESRAWDPGKCRTQRGHTGCSPFGKGGVRCVLATKIGRTN